MEHSLFLKKPVVESSIFAVDGVLCCYSILAQACVNKMCVSTAYTM
jgi:hypothetical protein